MADSLALLDEALELGRRELDMLARGEVETAERMALDRGKLLSRAWEQRDSASPAAMREKLVKMQTLQGELVDVATQLKESIRGQLKQNRQEGARLAGYGMAVRPRPRYNRYLSKHG